MRVKSELNIVFTDEQRIRTLLELDRVADAFDASHLLCLLLIPASSVGAWMTAIVPWELKLTLTVTHQTVSFHFLSQDLFRQLESTQPAGKCSLREWESEYFLNQ